MCVCVCERKRKLKKAKERMKDRSTNDSSMFSVRDKERRKLIKYSFIRPICRLIDGDR